MDQASVDDAIEDLVYFNDDPRDRIDQDRRVREALAEIVRERRRQEQKGRVRRAAGVDWRSCADPEMAGGDGTRYLVLGEEVGEVANASLEGTYGSLEDPDEHLAEELVQVAAVALAWLEAIAARRDTP